MEPAVLEFLVALAKGDVQNELRERMSIVLRLTDNALL